MCRVANPVRDDIHLLDGHWDARRPHDVTRNPNPHLAFGFGPSFRLGASLARIELRVMCSELLRRLPDLHLSGPAEPRRASNFISGPEAIPVEVAPAGATA